MKDRCIFSKSSLILFTIRQITLNRSIKYFRV